MEETIIEHQQYYVCFIVTLAFLTFLGLAFAYLADTKRPVLELLVTVCLWVYFVLAIELF